MGYIPLKTFISSSRRLIPSSILNIEVGIPWATILDQVVSLIALVKLKKGFQTVSFFLRNSASNFSVIVRTILPPFWDKVTVPTTGVSIWHFSAKALFI